MKTVTNLVIHHRFQVGSRYEWQEDYVYKDRDKRRGYLRQYIFFYKDQMSIVKFQRCLGEALDKD